MPRSATPFVRKTFELLNNEDLKEVVCWSKNGDSFLILNPDLFQTEVLPKFFKHGNLRSFVRQLNHYGFKKITKRDSKDLEFKHKLFCRGEESLLVHVVRRTKTADDEGESVDTFKQSTEGGFLKVLMDKNEDLEGQVFDLTTKHEETTAELAALRRDLNETRAFMRGFSASLGGGNQAVRPRVPPRAHPLPLQYSMGAHQHAQMFQQSSQPVAATLRRDKIFQDIQPLHSAESSPEALQSLAALPDFVMEDDFLNFGQ